MVGALAIVSENMDTDHDMTSVPRWPIMSRGGDRAIDGPWSMERYGLAIIGPQIKWE